MRLPKSEILPTQRDKSNGCLETKEQFHVTNRGRMTESRGVWRRRYRIDGKLITSCVRTLDAGMTDGGEESAQPVMPLIKPGSNPSI